MIRTESLALGVALLLYLPGPALADDGMKKKVKKGAAVVECSESEASALELFEQALSSCCATGACAASGECTPCDGIPPGKRLMKLLASSEDALAEIQPTLMKRFLAKETVDGQRHEMLALLLSCKGKAALACGEKLHEARPAAFSECDVMHFAVRGSKRFAEDTKKLAVKGRALPCALVALKGKAVGAEKKLAKHAYGTLAKLASSKELAPATLSDQYVAAVTLAQLGKKEHFVKLHQRVHKAVLVALDSDELKRARKLALISEFYGKVAKEGLSPMYLGYLPGKLKWHVAKRSEALVCADDVFELIEGMNPL